MSPLASAAIGSVYFLSGLEGSIAHLFADAPQAQLQYNACLSDDGSGGTCVDIPGSGSPLFNASASAVNPRGTAVYATSFGGAVSQVAASPSEGGGFTRFVGCRNNDGSDGCLRGPTIGNPLTNASDIVVSPNGASVYVVSVTEGTVSHFLADPAGKELLSWDGCFSDDGSGGACKKGPAAREHRSAGDEPRRQDALHGFVGS